MNIEQLRHFIVVAQKLSFSAAAKELYIAQPGLSQSIARLEKGLGLKLLERNRQYVKLTKSGEILLKEALEIVQKTDEAINKVLQSSTDEAGSLRIGFLPTLGVKYMPQWINMFQKDYPHIKVEPILCTEASIHKALDEGSIDLGYTRFFPEIYDSSIDWVYIHTESSSFVVSSNHPFADKKKIAFTSLCKEPMILMHKDASPGWNQFVFKYYRSKSIEPNVVEFAHRLDGLLPIVAFGHLISMVPSCAVLQGNPSISFIEIEDDDSHFDIGITWKKENDNENIRLFLDSINAARI